MNDVEPYAYLRDVLQRMVDGYPANRLNELLPWKWKARRRQELRLTHEQACAITGCTFTTKTLIWAQMVGREAITGF